MRCSLISLPFQDPSAPSLGLALISSALSERGVDHAIVDANLDFLHFIEQGRWGGDKSWPPFDPALEGNAKAYLSGFRRQQAMLQSLSAAFSDYRFTPYQLSFTADWPDLAAVKKTALSPLGIWTRWMEHGDILRQITCDNPHWVGLSINFDGQLPAAMALGHRLKREYGTTVVWGGGLLNAFADLLTEDTPIWDCVDGVILGAGEAMACRVHAGNGKAVPREALRLSNGGWIVRHQDLEPCRCPRFDRFPLGEYRAAGTVLPYRVFSRCHWGRCAFCADGRYHFHEDRLRGEPERVAEELLLLEAQYGARGIYFLDAELPASFMADMAESLHDKGSRLRWGGNSRLSEKLTSEALAESLYRGGCRFLRFGLESGSDDVLRKMGKGTTTKQSGRVVRSISGAGIGVHLYLMQGFPGETSNDAKQTERFLQEQADSIDSCNVSRFELYEGAPIALSLPQASIVRTANPGYWSYPRLQSDRVGVDTCRSIEDRFYAHKQQTRCFPTLADSILLADRFTLSYDL